MRPIDADALIDKIKYITGQDTIMWFDDRKIKREQEVNMVALIERVPTIDPVKRGKWIERERYRTTKDGVFHTYRYKVCSICGRASGRRMNKRTRYCPNCGARMDGDE